MSAPCPVVNSNFISSSSNVNNLVGKNNILGNLDYLSNYENILIITHNYIATFIEAIIKKQNINFKNDQILKNFTTSQFKKFLTQSIVFFKKKHYYIYIYFLLYIYSLN